MMPPASWRTFSGNGDLTGLQPLSALQPREEEPSALVSVPRLPPGTVEPPGDVTCSDRAQADVSTGASDVRRPATPLQHKRELGTQCPSPRAALEEKHAGAEQLSQPPRLGSLLRLHDTGPLPLRKRPRPWQQGEAGKAACPALALATPGYSNPELLRAPKRRKVQVDPAQHV